MKKLSPYFLYTIGIFFCLGVAGIASATSPTKFPAPNHQEQKQHQKQNQDQKQQQAQGQKQTAQQTTNVDASNQGVSAIAEGATVSQSVNTDIPAVTLGLGGSRNPGHFFTVDCMGPVEHVYDDNGKRIRKAAGNRAPIEGSIFSKGAVLETKIWCVKLQQRKADREDLKLALRAREIAIEERKLGMGQECQDTVDTLSKGIVACQNEAFGGKRR